MNEIMEQKNYLGELVATTETYCSFHPSSDEESALLFNLTNTPTHRLSDYINKIIEIVHVYVEVVECANDDGEFVKCPRVIFIDKNNESYQCVSVGVFSALKKIINAFGSPENWKSPKKIIPTQVTKGKRTMLTLSLK